MSALYYCVLQCSQSDSIFISDRGKQDFLDALRDLKVVHPFRLHAFALLESQVYLLLSNESGDVCRMLRAFVEDYSRKNNKRSSHTCYVFDQELKCKPCHQGKRVLPLIRYMHYLPVQFGQSHHPNLARWTSHLAYLGDPRYSFVDSADVLDLLAEDKRQALKLYQGLMAQSSSLVDITGSFIESNPETPTAEIEPMVVKETDTKPASPPSITLEYLADFITKTTGVKLEVMRGKGRAEHVVEARRMFIAAAVMVCSFPVSDVAKFLQVHHSYVSRLTFPRSEASKVMAQAAKELAVSLEKQYTSPCV